MGTYKQIQTLSKGKKILLVEDDKINARIILSLLKDLFFVKIAKDGQEGIDLYKKESFDIVISDIYMPKKDGVELCKEIREIDIEQPIAIISSTEDIDSIITLIDIGIQTFILKPISKDKFYEKLHSLLLYINYKKVAERARFREYIESKKNLKKLVKNQEKPHEKEEWELYIHEEEDIIFICNELENYINEIVFDKITNENITNVMYFLRKLSTMLSLVENFQSVSQAFMYLNNVLEENLEYIEDKTKADSFRLIEFIYNDVEKYMYDMFVHKSIKNMNYFVDSLNSNITNIKYALENKQQTSGDIYFF